MAWFGNKAEKQQEKLVNKQLDGLGQLYPPAQEEQVQVVIKEPSFWDRFNPYVMAGMAGSFAVGVLVVGVVLTFGFAKSSDIKISSADAAFLRDCIASDDATCQHGRQAISEAYDATHTKPVDPQQIATLPSENAVPELNSDPTYHESPEQVALNKQATMQKIPHRHPVAMPERAPEPKHPYQDAMTGLIRGLHAKLAGKQSPAGNAPVPGGDNFKTGGSAKPALGGTD